MTPNDLTVIHASNDLPDWLAADENSGAISGTPSAVQAATSATITVTGTGNYTGSIDVMVSIEVLAYNIGDTGPAGGRIFYENANHATDGWRYLEAAPKVLANQGYTLWSDEIDKTREAMGDGTEKNTVTGATDAAIGTGASNTARIVEVLDAEGVIVTHYAAKKCAVHAVSEGGRDYTDRFLPSKDELNAFYKAKTAAAGFDGYPDMFCWSSSESESDVHQAWKQTTANGDQREEYKNYTGEILPIRAFQLLQSALDSTNAECAFLTLPKLHGIIGASSGRASIPRDDAGWETFSCGSIYLSNLKSSIIEEMADMRLIKGQSVWITGASSGIGRELALIAAKAGASLVLISSNEERLVKTAQDCEEQGAELAHTAPMDLADSDSVILAVKELLAEHGAPDFLILNAGKSQRSLSGETNIPVMRKIMDINFFGAAVIGRLVVEEMAKKRSGHIAVTSSLTGRFGFPMRSSYAASKHALHGFFETLGLEYYSSGIRVSLVLLGRIKTDISLHSLDAQGEQHGVMDAGQAKGMAQGICAGKYWRYVLKGQPVVVIGGIETLMLAIHSYLPWLFRFIARRVNPL